MLWYTSGLKLHRPGLHNPEQMRFTMSDTFKPNHKLRDIVNMLRSHLIIIIKTKTNDDCDEKSWSEIQINRKFDG